MVKDTNLLIPSSGCADSNLPADAFAWFESVRGLSAAEAECTDRVGVEPCMSDRLLARRQIAWAVDVRDHSLSALTASAALVFGRPVEELRRRPGLLWKAIHPDDRDVMTGFFSQCDDEKVRERSYRIRRPDGEVRVLRESAVLLRDEDGRPERVEAVLVDETEAPHPMEDSSIFRFSMELAHDAVFIMGPDNRFLEVNQAAVKALGYTREELLGMSVPDITPDYPAEALDEIWRRLRRDGSILMEARHQAKDGRIYPVEITGNYVRHEGREYICVFARDISGRKTASTERRERLVRLQRHKEAFERLASDSRIHGGDRHEALQLICETGAHALEVERAGVWLLEEDSTHLRCENLYEHSIRGHMGDLVLDASHCATYFASIRNLHVVDAHAAMTDPRTSEFAENYLRPLGIHSKLDATIRVDGRLVGVIAFEHTGSSRTWTQEESAFAGTVAEHVAHLLERNERQRREEELQEERRRLKTLIGSLPGMAFRIRKADDWPVEFISEGSTALTGWTPDDLIGNKNVAHIDVVHPEDRDMVWEVMAEALRTRQAYEIEYRITTRQGEVKWVWERGQGIYDEIGEVVAAEGFVTDISGRILAEQALRESEFRHRELFHNMWTGVAVFESGDGGMFLCSDLNMAGERIDGVSKANVIGVDAREAFSGIEECGLLDVMSRVRENGRPAQLKEYVYRDDWSESWRESYVYRLPGGEIVVVYEDVTERMNREADLRLKKFTINQTNDAIFWIARDGSFLDANTTACSQYGYERDELLRLGVFDLTDEYTPDSWEKSWHAVRKSGSWRKEGLHKVKDGRTFPVDISISHLEFEGQEYFCALVRDITERKESEQQISRLNQTLEKRVEERTTELHDSREKYRLLIESLRERYIFYSLKSDGSYQYLSPSVANVLGYGVEDYGENHLRYLTDIPENRVVETSTALSLKGLEQPPFEMEIRHKDGSTRVLEVMQVPVCDEKGRVVSVEGIAHDVTEQKRNLEMIRDQQDQLLESEKMAALGSLVAGVAHEINTPVGIGVTAASHLQDRVEQYRTLYEEGALRRSEFEAFLRECGESSRMILSNLDKASQLIQGFKGVAVDQTGEGRRSFDLKQYLDEILLSLRPELKRTSYEVVMDCPDGIIIDNYPGAVSHTVTNLVMNSLIHGFAGREKGRIEIEASSDGEKAVVVYRDDGVGMSEEIRRKVYEPFFTTRRGQGGSGLGMNVVYNSITQSLGGTISCTSAPGQGTTFTMEFPLRNGSGDDAAR